MRAIVADREFAKFKELQSKVQPQDFLTCVECLLCMIKGQKPSLLAVVQRMNAGKHFRV